MITNIPDYLPLLGQTTLFHDISQAEILGMMDCLSATIRQYPKNKYLYMPGDNLTQVGLVLTGSVMIVKEDFWGNRSILSEIHVGELFGETYACTRKAPLEVGIVASESCQVLYLNFQQIMTVCTSACDHHSQLIQNLVSAIAMKNLQLTKKLEHMSQKTTREKLLSYLSNESRNAGNDRFVIPFNRQELADYLSVDRSAMSSELSKLKKEGILDFQKNAFFLKQH